MASALRIDPSRTCKAGGNSKTVTSTHHGSRPIIACSITGVSVGGHHERNECNAFYPGQASENHLFGGNLWSISLKILRVRLGMPHKPIRLNGLVSIMAAIFLACLCGSTTALANTADPAPVPTSLIKIDLVKETRTESKFIFTFSPRANSFGVVGEGTGKASIGFALSTRGNGAVTPPNLKGIVREITFNQVETVLIVHFATGSPAEVNAVAVDSDKVEVTISNGVKKTTSTQGNEAHGPLPPASEIKAGDVHELVMLRYADVSEVVGVLTEGLTVKSNDNFTPREPGFGSTSLTGGSYTPANSNATSGDSEPLGQSVDGAVAIDRRLNAIWLKGTPERVAQMKEEIALVDVPVDSVVLQTEIVELDETGSSALGIDFNNDNGQLAVATQQTGQYIPSGYAASSGSHLNAAGTVVGGALSSVSLQAALYAQVTKGNGKIISRPSIVAQSGGSAKIITGDALPILTSITLSGVNGVSQQVQYVNVGVTLQIAPRISSDGFVTSHVFCVVSSETGTSQGYPTISQREAETMVSVKDGETFVIGGLTQDSILTSDSKVPGLGDIPLLGGLFHHKSVTKQKTELYIVVTPRIIHHSIGNSLPKSVKIKVNAKSNSHTQRR